ncbi:glycosyl hydrolase [Streptomyces sp. NPDC020883]|uniref:glycosyl hydrolase n=1 Tax=Streptomyces sp. NPDC020883 TaxID=3365099 RepID=UPI003790F30D
MAAVSLVVRLPTAWKRFEIHKERTKKAASLRSPVAWKERRRRFPDEVEKVMRVSRVFGSRRGVAATAASLALITAAVTGCAGHTTATASGAAPVAAAAPATSGSSMPGTLPSTGASSGVLFGGDAQLSGLTHLGRSSAIVRTYDTIDTASAFPSADETGALHSGATLLASLGTGHNRAWASISAGTSDATVLKFLRAVDDAATTHHLSAIYVSFNHEPNAKIDAGKGKPAQFVAAWRHVYQLAAHAHLNVQTGGHLHWVWILTASGFHQDGVASSFWPGAQYVDAVGADGYVSGGCTKQKSGNYVDPANTATKPDAVFGPALTWSTTHAKGKPVFIPEWGSVPFTNPGVRPSYINAMTKYVVAHPQISAVMYWNDHAHKDSCDYALDNDLASQHALAAMGANAHFRAQP